jgi:hypothetical protein
MMEMNLGLNVDPVSACPVRAIFLQSVIPFATLATTFVSAERRVDLCFQAEVHQYSLCQLSPFLTRYVVSEFRSNP